MKISKLTLSFNPSARKKKKTVSVNSVETSCFNELMKYVYDMDKEAETDITISNE